MRDFLSVCGLVRRMMALRRLEIFNLVMLMFSFISLVFFVFLTLIT